MNPPTSPEWQQAAREYNKWTPEARTAYWQRLNAEQRSLLTSALQQLQTTPPSLTPKNVTRTPSGCTRLFRHGLGFIIAPFIAACIASAFAQANPDVAFYAALVMTYVGGVPVALPLVALALTFRLHHPLWYIVGGAVVSVASPYLLAFAIGKGLAHFFGSGTGHSFATGGGMTFNEWDALLIMICVTAGLVAGAAYFVIAEWTPGRRQAMAVTR